MKKLKVFGCQLDMSSDDFVFFGSLDLSFRVFGLIVMAVEFSRFQEELECDKNHLINTYLTGLMVLFSLVVILSSVMVHYSMRGTIINDAPRRRMPQILYVRFVVMVLEWLWDIIGAVWVTRLLSVCDESVFWLASLSLSGGWLAGIVQLFLIYFYVDFRKGDHQSVITKHDWEKRWQNICCCLSGEETKNVFSTLSNLCVAFFKKEELVPSDIMAGLMLVYRKQKQKRHRLDVVDSGIAQNLRSKMSKPPQHQVTPSKPTPKPWMTLPMMAHYMKFALGSYGWPYFIGLNNPVIATCRLLPRLRWRFWKKPPDNIQKDGKLMANTAAFMLTTGLRPEHLLYITFHNEIKSIPFYVTVDHTYQAVVISLRGTLSLEDIVTDLVVDREPITVNGVKGASVHQGMLHSAEYIQQKLQEERILEKAFQEYENYRLVITGHSLGAGVAALLSILLKPIYPGLICFAYAPPGELVSDNLIEYSQDFICSVSLGYDVVPRLGILELKNLKIHILEAIRDCPLPKHQIMASGLWLHVFGSHLEDLDQLKVSPDLLASKEYQDFNALLREEIEDKEKILSNYEPLFPPGQILHVLERDSKRKRRRVPEYCAEWTNTETFREIILSMKMIAHHFPDTLLDALGQLCGSNEPVSNISLNLKQD